MDFLERYASSSVSFCVALLSWNTGAPKQYSLKNVNDVGLVDQYTSGIKASESVELRCLCILLSTTLGVLKYEFHLQREDILEKRGYFGWLVRLHGILRVDM